MNIAVIGTGYVGLVTGCCLAEAGHTVVCIDNDSQKVAALRQGEAPIFEPGLEEYLRRNIEKQRISFTTDLADGVRQAEAIFLALPTPPSEDGSADLTTVLGVAGQLGSCLPAQYCVVIDKSTVPVGTAEKVHAAIAGDATTAFDVVSNPEFLREGMAVQDFMEPERIVIGTDAPRAEAVMRELYAPFISDERPLLTMDRRTAELAKYAANSFLVTKISFMNEIAQLCERLDADVDMLRRAIGYDSRIGHKFLFPGIGYGGSCFPKDVRALQRMAAEQQYDFKLINAALAVNAQQQSALVHRILEHFPDGIQGRTFALWGLSFKPNTDDIRESPALVIIDALLQHGAHVVGYDPEAGDHVRAKYTDNSSLQITDDKYQALQHADALVVATEWSEFLEADIARIASELTQPVVFDGRNIYHPAEMQRHGFAYYSIGRKPVTQQA